ncbi:TetR/AcrR family transcriptional regulator [Phaeovibrio sulfidiphilus]|uniref:TetR/AcrR family transcriptional regulator n=1 Tax=Phaeovibrio sulfidiphilus TaxID=1220600 RepID=A0A8J6YL48_9PROT|nr:TetR/AcrR family transcriptional regulator [Phaeovibrio sulfidiphilus]MBE1236335.1 TetR/AcrR family transcriptional regulator [Phaeovibrio sulfidiphilus]
MARGDTRRLILEAALECFLANGFTRTSIADIKARSRTTTGSVYHFFEGKEDIALTLCIDALRSKTAALADVPQKVGARDMIHSLVGALVRWGTGHPGYHRFLMQTEFLAPGLALNPELIDLQMEARLARERLLRELASSPAVRELPADVLWAMIVGPAETYLYEHAHGRTLAFLDEAIEALAEAAWRAIRQEDQALAGESEQKPAPPDTPPRTLEWDLL